MSLRAADIRNVAFVGHPSSGKTTLVDALAFKMGASDRQGTVAEKTSICDTEPEEQDKQHTLVTKSVHALSQGKEWNLFDTPGYPDFVSETTSSIMGADLVAGVVSASSGVTFNLVKKMARAAELGRGRALVITHLDAENTDFDELVMELRARIGEICVPVVVPDQSGPGLSKVIDVRDDPDHDWRKRLMDRVMDACEDEELLMEYLDSQNLTEEQLSEHMPLAVEKGALIPILIVNPVTGLGIDEMIRFFAHYGPAPTTKPMFEAGGEPVAADMDGDFLGVVFAVRSDAHMGKVSLARILRGRIKASDLIVAVGGEEKGEKPGGMFHFVGGKKREAIEEASAGDVIALSKVEHVKPGDTITIQGIDAPQVTYPPAPTPMVAHAVQPKSRADEQKIGEALAKLAAEDRSLRVHTDPLTHDLIVEGMSDLHLQVMEARLKRRYGVEIESKLPRIAYRETVTKSAEGHHRHKKQSGGRGQFGECYVRIKPGEKDSGFVFNDKVVGGSIPRNLIPAVEKGARELCAEGILTHSQVVDVELELYDGKFHQVDSDEASFKRAGAGAFRDAFEKAGPVLMEPVMSLEIHIPTRDAGTIFSDLTSQRRGHVLDQTTEDEGASTVVKAHVPLASVQTYFRDLKSQTAGEGYYTMLLDHYAPVPAAEQKKILAQAQKQHEDH
jgi:elongation factor G